MSYDPNEFGPEPGYEPGWSLEPPDYYPHDHPGNAPDDGRGPDRSVAQSDPDEDDTATLLRALSVIPDSPDNDAEAEANKLAKYRRRSVLADGPYTDVGNSERLVLLYADKMLYAHEQQCWYAWDGRRFRRDSAYLVQEFAKQVARGIYEEGQRLKELERDKKGKPVGDDNGLSSWGLASQGKGHVTAMIDLARSDPRLVVDLKQLDTHPWLLNCMNGTLDLQTGVLEPHDPADRLTKLAPVTYDPEAKCPMWTGWIEQMHPTLNIRDFLQEVYGYCLTGDTSEQRAFVDEGPGSNGKSTFFEVLAEVLGDDYYAVCPNDLLSTQEHEPHPTGLAKLRGARMAVTAEWEKGAYIDEEKIKKYSGGDKLTARFMREDFWDFRLDAKISIYTNDLPKIRGTNYAIRRRMVRIPWTVTIRVEDRDLHLKEKLLAEKPGILRWLVKGERRRQDRGMLEVPEEIKTATDDYLASEDRFGLFLADKCVQHPKAIVGATELYNAYRAWTYGGGLKAFSMIAMGETLKERGFERTVPVAHTKKVVWEGIGLAADAAPPAP